MFHVPKVSMLNETDSKHGIIQSLFSNLVDEIHWFGRIHALETFNTSFGSDVLLICDDVPSLVDCPKWVIGAIEIRYSRRIEDVIAEIVNCSQSQCMAPVHIVALAKTQLGWFGKHMPTYAMILVAVAETEEDAILTKLAVVDILEKADTECRLQPVFTNLNDIIRSTWNYRFWVIEKYIRSIWKR